MEENFKGLPIYYCPKCKEDRTDVTYTKKESKKLTKQGVFLVGVFCNKCGAFIKWARQNPYVLNLLKNPSKTLF
jgi:hypothetical protein